MLIEMTLVECSSLAGRWSELHRQVSEGVLSLAKFNELTQSLKPQEDEVWRQAAGSAAQILYKIKRRQERSGKKGRPRRHGSADELLDRQDIQVLKDASARAASNTMADIEAAIPGVVREYLRLGLLRTLGETEGEAVDRHSRRLRETLKRMAKNAPTGGSSIIRKVFDGRS
jgi:hypothetical protein